MVGAHRQVALGFSQSSHPMRCTNHSCQPTARLTIRGGRVESFVLVPIAPGDQITVDYGETHHEGRLACRCGAHGCRVALQAPAGYSRPAFNGRHHDSSIDNSALPASALGRRHGRTTTFAPRAPGERRRS